MKNLIRKWLDLDLVDEDIVSLEAGLAELRAGLLSLSTAFNYHDHEEEPPAEPPPLPFYIKYLRKAHPDKSDEELSETVWLTCQTATWFYEPIYQDAAKTYWNDNAEGWPICQPAVKKDDHEIRPDMEVLVYRWAFPVNAGTAREVVYHIDGLKRLINIKAFSAPE